LDRGAATEVGKAMAVAASFPRVAVIGAGAVGGYFGVRLALAGAEVHFLVRGGAAQIRREGFRVHSDLHGELAVEKPQVWEEAAAIPACDFVLVAVKTTANGQLPALLPPSLLAPDAVVVMLQNGLDVEAAAAAAAPGHAVLGGVTYISAWKEAPGRIRHSEKGLVKLAEWTADGRPAGVTPAVAAARGLFQAAGIPAEALPDLLLPRWQKLLWNIPYNGLSVVLGADTAALSADPAARRLVATLMAEVRAAAAAWGREIPAAFAAAMAAGTAAMPPYRPSMLQDWDAGRPLEIEAIYRTPLRRAAEKGVAMPVTAALAEQLSFLAGRCSGLRSPPRVCPAAGRMGR